MASHGLRESDLVFAHQRPGGEFAEAFPPGDRPDATVVLQERRELCEREEVYRSFRHIPVRNAVAESPQPGKSSSVPGEGLVVREARPGRPWSRGGGGTLKSPVESIPVHSWAATRSAIPRREEVVGPAHQFSL